jgi:hypothetical protein
MSYDNYNDPASDAPAKVSKTDIVSMVRRPDQSDCIDNNSDVLSLKKPMLRLVKTLHDTTAKILPFKGPLSMIVGGFMLSIYALI